MHINSIRSFRNYILCSFCARIGLRLRPSSLAYFPHAFTRSLHRYLCAPVYDSSGKFIGLVHNPYCLCRYVASIAHGWAAAWQCVCQSVFVQQPQAPDLSVIEHQVKLADCAIAPRAYLLHIDGFAKTFRFLGVLALMILISAFTPMMVRSRRVTHGPPCKYYWPSPHTVEHAFAEWRALDQKVQRVFQ